MKDLELRLTDLLARKADEVDVRPVDGFPETPCTTALASTDLDSVTETRDLATIDLEATNARPAPSRNRRRVAQGVLAATAVVAIALVATHDGVGPTDEPSPIATVPPTMPPRALLGTTGGLVQGTYFVEVNEPPTARIFFSIGGGWRSNHGAGIEKFGPGTGRSVIGFDRAGAVFSDACHPSEGYHPGPVTTLDGLVAALSEQQGWADVTAPSDISIDGYVGKAFQRTVPAGIVFDCDINYDVGERVPDDVPGFPDFRSWENLNTESGSGGDYYEPGEIETLWVLDIDGTVIVISTGLWPGRAAADHLEVVAVLDSIRIARGSDVDGIPGVDTIGTEVMSPLELVRESLTSGADAELFRMTTDEPTYWRLTTLPEFDGRRFRLPKSDLSPIDDTADSPPDGRTIRQQLQILALGGQLIPAAADPTQAAPSTDLQFNPDTSTLLTTGELASGNQYTIVSHAPDATLDELRVATTDNPPDDLVLGLPDNVPGVVSDLAAEVTAEATTDADKMIALQDWFRNEFTYDLTTPAGHDGDAIEMFLETRRGFCEQFASTFAVMARTLGIPSRVAVGFTPGRLNVDGSYSVFGTDSHAWPEIWFDGIGWIPFEPTPQRAIPGAAY